MAKKVNVHFEMRFIDGKLTPVPVSSKYFYGMMNQHFKTGEKVIGVFRKPYKKHTDAQRAYLFGVVYDAIAQHTGHTKEDLHDLFMREFFNEDIVEVGGIQKSKRKSLTEVTKKEGKNYIDWLVQFAAEQLNVTVPEPSKTGHNI